jgi:hypothetical protein
MTTNMTSRLATAELERITVELAEAREDVALLERLKSAVDRVSRLAAEQDKAIKARDKALAAEAKAEEQSRFGGINDLVVTDNTPDEHVLRSGFTITYTKPAWNGRASVPKAHSVGGFGALHPDVFRYLIERCPERIPAKIMALAPDNPVAAFNRYFVSLKRGYVTSK